MYVNTEWTSLAVVVFAVGDIATTFHGHLLTAIIDIGRIRICFRY